jgi:uncharacterized protein YcaQ
MTSSIKISLAQARNLAMNCQLLDGNTKINKGKAGVVQVIEHLGYIQVDTIAVIERAHHHTIWTRVPSYRPEMLDELQARDRKVFEYWGHAASYLPMKDYRFYLPKMKTNLSEHPRWQKWADNNKKLLNQVLKRIQKEGPLGAKDFADSHKKKRGTWWDWKPAKTALETLHTTGELMVFARRKFERVFDLTERVLPKSIITKIPSQEELVKFAIHRALKAHGLVTIREILNHIHIVKEKNIRQYLADMLDSNNIIKVKIEGINTEYYTNHKIINSFEGLPKKKALHILSPFDNFIIQRDRIKRLFNFDYQLECYKPPNQRIYGYFVLPILWGNEFIGRIDLKANRANKQLIVRNLLIEFSSKQVKDMLSALVEKLKELAAFNKTEQVIIEQTNPSNLKTSLNKTL